jgi:hypothetical protein
MILEHYREDYYTGRGRQFSDYGALWIRKILGIMIPLKERSGAFDEISVRNPRPDSDGIVSVSLWGDGVSDRFRKELVDPLLSNVDQLRSRLPGWVCRVYASSELPEQVIVELVDAGCEVYIMPAPRQGGEGFAWRFLATAEQKPAIVHDADMTFDELRPGLFDVVKQWLKTDKPFLRRQLSAVNVWGNPVSGGCWGSRPRSDGKNPLVDMKDRLSKYSFHETRGILHDRAQFGFSCIMRNSRTLRYFACFGVYLGSIVFEETGKHEVFPSKDKTLIAKKKCFLWPIQTLMRETCIYLSGNRDMYIRSTETVLLSRQQP